MGLFNRYVSYLKNNPKGYWFRRKVWGWGWVPATWQGWAAIAVFCLALLFIVLPFSRNSQPIHADVWAFLGKVLLAVIVLLFVTYSTGEPPKWQWGFPEEE